MVRHQLRQGAQDIAQRQVVHAGHRRSGDLQDVGLLDKAVERSSTVFAELAGIREQFGRRYAAALAAVKKRGLPTDV